MLLGKTEYLWEQKRGVYHLQRKRYVSLCGGFWFRGRDKHLTGGFMRFEDPPEKLCPDCAREEK